MCAYKNDRVGMVIKTVSAASHKAPVTYMSESMPKPMGSHKDVSSFPLTSLTIVTTMRIANQPTMLAIETLSNESYQDLG